MDEGEGEPLPVAPVSFVDNAEYQRSGQTQHAVAFPVAVDYVYWHPDFYSPPAFSTFSTKREESTFRRVDVSRKARQY